MMTSGEQIVRTEVTETLFGFYTDNEKKKKLSVCNITLPMTLNANMQPIISGLYDGHMGPLDQGVTCLTCNLGYVNCPGHPGHIELDVPVYYPLLFPSMFQILRSKCVFCHKLRMSMSRARYYLIKLKLIEMGEMTIAEELHDSMQPSILFNEDDEIVEEEITSKKKGNKKDSSDIEEKLKLYERRYEAFSSSGKRRTLDANAKQLQRETIEEFQRAALAIKKCENCDAYSPPFRKDGFTKIFQKPMPKRLRKSMPSSRFKYRTALEYMNAHKNATDVDAHSQGGTDSDDDSSKSSGDSDSESVQGDAVVDAGVEEADKYLVPLEVEAQIQLLWQKNGDILDYIWKRCIHNDVKYGEAQGNKKQLDKHFSVNEEGWRIFFTRVVLVPPNKFRPAAKVGESTSEHPQNIHLIRILEHNSKIRLLQGSVDISRMNGYGNVNAAVVEEQDDKGMELSKLITSWIDLQNAVNCYIDSAKDPNPLGSQGAPSGIRQLLERKEGMFRRHMMGKRVNYCCRSVISPDNYIGTNEIGIPVKFAMALHYPTPVNDWNVKYLRTLVERGPNEYPGANQIETADGRIIKLEKLSAMERAGKAKLLLATPGNKVYRHLIDGDVLLVNRQPTLQKPGIMAHKARVLRYVKEQTLRMHYANCNTYNADFDGDEMNCHFVQSELARAEATFICNNDNQYIGPTSGNPLRGLIQDHVAGGVKLTCKDTFLTKSEFQQLLYIAVTGLPGTEIVSPMEEMNIPQPAVWKPVKRWTGKQVISALMSHMCRAPLPSLHLDGKTRTPATAFGAEHQEHEVIIRHGELLCGVLDKNAIGSVSLGIVHAVYELYGAELAGRLLNAFGRLFTYVLQDFGLTCGIADLILTKDADAERRKLLLKVGVDAEQGVLTFLKTTTGEEIHKTSAADANKPLTKSQRKDAEKRIGEFLAVDRVNQKVKMDGAMQSVINKSASDVIKACLPNGLAAPFLQNNFSIMVLTGAKGSAVNQSQISCFLGQQALEGQRVPLMVSGKSLPSFKPNDSSARAGGFVQDRFLTGVKPQEYYFHCMAGREGLVDTAVKTSRSGYLQRCLVKHLEELKIHYDNTVRDSGGNVVQFLYGEDGLDPIQASLLGGKANQMLFLARNNQALVHKFSLHQDFFNQGLEMESAQKHHQRVTEARKLVQNPSGDDLQTQLKVGSVVLARRKIHADTNWCRGNIIKNWVSAEVVKTRVSDSGSHYFDLRYIDTNEIEKKVPVKLMVRPRMSAGGGPHLSQAPKLAIYLIKAGLPETSLNTLSLASCIGAVSEKIQDAVTTYAKKNPDGVITAESSETTVTAEALELLVWVKYMRSMACPGEAVGCVAAQSVGEPSTQMTLNTFHLAGHGGANVTLGIPRLREIIMTASRSLKTPTMLVPLAKGKDMLAAKTLAAELNRLSLSQLLHHKGGVEVGECIDRNGSLGQWERKYRIRLVFQKPESIEAAFGLSFETIVNSISKTFLAKLDHYIKYEQRRAGERVTNKNDPLKAFRAVGGDKSSSTADGEEGEDNDDENQPSSSSTKKSSSKNKSHGDSDEDEDEDAGDDNADDDLGNLKLGGSGKEVEGYDEDEEEADLLRDSDDSDAEDKEGEAKKAAAGSDSDGSDSETDGDDEKLNSIGVSDKKAPAAKAKAAKKVKVEQSDKIKSDAKKGYIEIEMSFPARSRRLLMAQIAEKAASVTMVRFTKDIANSYAIQGEGLESANHTGVVVEGVNFEAIWAVSDDLIDMNAIKSNDIYRILTTYGVEAARQCIVSEITGVFNVYGIDVNSRHLSLIADFMTRNGSYAAMNRIGMNECPSPFLQMSFETTCTFLTKAAQEGLSDTQESPSSRIVLGSVTKVGTGCFDLMLPLNDKQ